MTPERVRPTRTAVAPTRLPVQTTLATPVPRAAKVPPAPAAPSTRQAWLDRAARDRQRNDADRKAQYTIQLELACEIPSLVDAWKYDRPAGTMWVLTTPFDGQTCFRVLWGLYPTREAALRALSSTPKFFSTPRNRPVVTAIR
jgi:septal ring-binding cell division protein DamX